MLLDSWIPVVLYGVGSGFAIGLFGLDKGLATKGGGLPRIPEWMLHASEAAFGWPGAILAMVVFRHKIRKCRFLFVTACIVAAHAAGWWLVLSWIRPPA